MADGKWIGGLTPQTSVVDAARRVLSARLGAVRQYLHLAAVGTGENIEHVHQLRVTSRRADAAIRIFQPWLSPKRAESARKHVRTFRRAAGMARDWDVFREMLGKWTEVRPVEERPALDFLHGHAFAYRCMAQHRLREAADVHFNDREFVATIGESLNFRLARRLGELSTPFLKTALEKLDRALSGNLNDEEQLHQIRIRGKKLRYALEIFIDCLAIQFREQVYPAVEKLQEVLGDMNDDHVAIGRITQIQEGLSRQWPADWPRFRPGIEQFLQARKSRSTQSADRFHAWVARWKELRNQIEQWLSVVQMETA